MNVLIIRSLYIWTYNNIYVHIYTGLVDYLERRLCITNRLNSICKAPIEFNLQGTLQAPATGNGDTWFSFLHVDFLTVSGTGIFDGNGKSAWGQKCDKTEYCSNLPIVRSKQTHFVTISFAFYNIFIVITFIFLFY